MLQQIMAHIAAIKKDMIILEKSEFSTLKHEYEVRCAHEHFFLNNVHIHFFKVANK